MCAYLLDVDVLLDYYDNLRRFKYPYSVWVFEYLKNNKNGFVSSSSLDKIVFLKTVDIVKDKNISFRSANHIAKFMLKEITTFFKVIKTPSYIDIDEYDIETAQLIASAKAIGAKIITRDRKILEKYPGISLHPKDFFDYLHRKPKIINMLDITKQTLLIYEKIEKKIDEVIHKSNFILGEEVKEFEKRVAEYIGSKHAIGVASGTDALLLSLRALAIKKKKQEFWSKDDLIITSPFTFTATGDTILRSGATPLFVDIDLETYNIDPAQVKNAINKFRNQIVGIVPVHLYGLSCDMNEIMNIAEENGLFVVEDCAQAFGSMYKGRKVGSFGDTGAFSFFPTKNLGAFGDAGLITTSDDELADLIRALRVHGGRDKYNVDHIGYKARIDTIQSAVLLAKLDYIDTLNEARIQVAQVYTKYLSDIEFIKLPQPPSKNYFHTYNQFTIYVDKGLRDFVQQGLRKYNIQTAIYYPHPLHRMKLFIDRSLKLGQLKNAELASRSVLSLPMPILETNDTIEYIAELVRKTILELEDKNYDKHI